MSNKPIWLLLFFLLGACEANAQEIMPIECRITRGVSNQRVEISGSIVNRHLWDWGGENFTGYFAISTSHLNRLNKADRNDLVEMVHIGTQQVEAVAKELLTIADERNWSPEQLARFTLAMVQALPYELDAEGTLQDEFYRYPSETLSETTSDCEDTSILLASLLRASGIPVVLLSPPGHLAVGISGKFIGKHVDYHGVKYYYAETTGSGFEPGVLPDEINGQLKVISIDDGIPSSVIDWPNRENREPTNVISPRQQVPRRAPIPASTHKGSTRLEDQNGLMFWLVLLVLAVAATVVTIVIKTSRPTVKPSRTRESWETDQEYYEQDMDDNFNDPV